MEAQKPHDLDVFELTRSELNVVLSIIGKLPFEQVSQVMAALTSRPPARAVTAEQLAEVEKAVKAQLEAKSKSLADVGLETAADVSDSSNPSEEELTTEQ